MRVNLTICHAFFFYRSSNLKQNGQLQALLPIFQLLGFDLWNVNEQIEESGRQLCQIGAFLDIFCSRSKKILPGICFVYRHKQT